MSERPWLAAYPAGVPSDIDPSSYPSLVALMEQAFNAYGPRPAYAFMGKDISFSDIDRQSLAFAAYFQSLELQPGDRIAIMMPNVPQYHILLFCAYPKYVFELQMESLFLQVMLYVLIDTYLVLVLLYSP